MLLNSSATSVLVNVIDNVGTALVNATVRLYLYDLTSNTYQVNQIFITDSAGQGFVSVQLNSGIYYFTVDYQGSTRLTTLPTGIYSDTVQLTVPLVSPGFSKLFDSNNLQGEITASTVTLYQYQWIDADNLATQGCLYAYQFLTSTLQLYNSTCTNTSSGSVTVGLNNASNQTYYLYGVTTKNDQDYTVDTAIVQYASGVPGENTTKMWLFLMLIVMLLLIFMFRDVPAIAVIIAGLVPLLFSAAGLISIKVGYTVALFIISIIIAIIIGL
jgi:hypothetical protein